ncbi:quaternary amine ABC transporter ATP-binding protein [Lentibacillus amyloliquefaciens]|uniref:Quaternary amine transport ATP-binding protein n=1 Tax=Lentibacillus amyloliquefaciens TaxID=1472767 RepID=A0A0U3WFT3_9BACI|nr:glycine betaine/L-proline ABC transporter ATP-binding protein [Lentibacillus amyloliquefaciens]ALX48703.1 glycine betaine/L-proline ABC transporter ATP-binding protein [Lentibacillus amyloliquefaciens]
MSKIKVDRLTKIFGRRPKQAVKYLEEKKSKDEILKLTGMTVGVNQASFEVEEGEVFVIMGLSGSGKSTLVRMLNRLIEPTSGDVMLGDDNITDMSKEKLRDIRRKKMSMVFQNFALLPHKTILKNAEYGLEIQGIDKSEREKKATDALELVGLGGYMDKYPSELSGGMQQRVGLARALANDPEILLMDEAFSALDPLIRKDMQDELMDLQQRVRKTIVFITHDLNEALRIGDRIALMKDGSIVQIGTAEEILMDPANDYVERFVEDVDLAKVLTAGHVMKRAETVSVDRGANVALKLMKDDGISTIYVVDKQQKLLGYVTADEASDAAKENKNLEDILTTDIPTVHQETLLVDIFEPMADEKAPLSVVDEAGKLLGIVVRGSVIGALAGNNEVLNENGGEVTNG